MAEYKTVGESTVDDEIFNLPRNEFEAKVKSELDYLSRDLLEVHLDEYEKRNG